MSLALSYDIPVFVPAVYQVVTFDGSAQSAAFAVGTRLIRISANQDCWYKIGANPTANQTDSCFLAKGAIDHREVLAGQKIAVAKDTAAGKASVTEETL
jgi:hypothetical protein